jgi:plasmid stabilization system protein ParE
MVRQIIWAKREQQDRKAILSNWNDRNNSKVYSKKLNRLFIQAIEILAYYPQLGRKTDNEKARIKIIKDYFIIYEFDDIELRILSIFDTRQDPTKFKKIID